MKRWYGFWTLHLIVTVVSKFRPFFYRRIKISGPNLLSSEQLCVVNACRICGCHKASFWAVIVVRTLSDIDSIYSSDRLERIELLRLYSICRYREHVVWADKELNLKLMRKGLLTRLYVPQVRVEVISFLCNVFASFIVQLSVIEFQNLKIYTFSTARFRDICSQLVSISLQLKLWT